MNVLVIGAGGFVGRNVCDTLIDQGHELIPADRELPAGNGVRLDLSDPESIARALADTKPDSIINCAGIIENSKKAQLNVAFTRNLLEQIVASGLPLKRLVTMGSAAEYGPLEPKDLPVREDHPLNGLPYYGRSKVEEAELAFGYRKEGKVPVIVARLFNPIGVGIAGRLLVPRLLGQLEDIQAGRLKKVEVNRLDARRDYVHVRDVAAAIVLLATKEPLPQHKVYNVGSGQSASNADIIGIMLEKLQLLERPEIVELSDNPEPMFGTQADISRLREEFGWSPGLSLKEAIEEIIDAKRR